LNQEQFMSEEQTVTYELEGEIALVGLNRPDKRNCFNPTVMKQLREAIERAGEEAKCGIIFGHGDNFCAGLDLRWAAESWKTGRSERLPFPFNRNTYFEAMARGNIPFIAALHGATLAAGSRRLLPRISASPTKPRSSRCPRERAASSSVAAARFAWRGCSALPACRT
jgi:enoyl-CoA hydratase/carnithine racemase